MQENIATNVRGKIISELHDIEENHGVKVLYACESGSRAWGFESQDSDWDVRFIYAHPMDWYLKVNVGYTKLTDTINRIDKDTNLDFSGWDLKKSLFLFSKGNPHLFEYLRSPVQYIDGDTMTEWMRRNVHDYFSLKSSIYHYFHMARNNYERYLQGDIVSYKKYLYVLRPLFCCQWIEAYNSSPPVEFDSVMYEFTKDYQLLAQINLLVHKKRQGMEMDGHPKIQDIDKFIVDRLEYYDNMTKDIKFTVTNKDNLLRLNRIFSRYIRGLPI